MEDNKHTPGPWKVEKPRGTIVCGDNRAIFASSRSVEEADANAELIARAPDMAVEIESWAPLAKIAPPEKWLEMYTHYQEILIKEDTAGWYVEQGNMALSQLSELQKVNAELHRQGAESLLLYNSLVEQITALQTENTALKQQVAGMEKPPADNRWQPLRHDMGNGKCVECNKNWAEKDYNGHGHWVCTPCYDILNNEFEEVYR